MSARRSQHSTLPGRAYTDRGRGGRNSSAAATGSDHVRDGYAQNAALTRHPTSNAPPSNNPSQTASTTNIHENSAQTRPHPSIINQADSASLLGQLIRAIYVSNDQNLNKLVTAIRRANALQDVTRAVEATLQQTPTRGVIQSRAYQQLLETLSNGTSLSNDTDGWNVSNGEDRDGDMDGDIGNPGDGPSRPGTGGI